VESLADKIRRDGALNELDAVGWVIRLAKRIEVLHSRGIAHGGVTPASVRVDGVSRASHGVLADAQPDAATPSFHSPERLTAGGRSTSDDTWAVAATLYAALTGSEPFGGADAQEIRQKILAATVAPLAVFDVGDDDLQRVLDEAFARDIQRRTVKISALREALETWHPDPTTRDLPPLQEDEDYDDDEATVMRPAMLPLLAMPASNRRSSQPRILGDKSDAVKGAAAAEPASSDEVTSAPGTHPSGGGAAPPRPAAGSPAAGSSAPRPASGNPAAPRPASAPRAVPASGSRSAPGTTAARSTAPRLLARKPDERAAPAPAQRSGLQAAQVVTPVIREVAEPASQPAAVPTTVRSSVVKVHDDDEDNEATVMREGIVAVTEGRRPDGGTPGAGKRDGGIPDAGKREGGLPDASKPEGRPGVNQPAAQAADAPPDTVDGESRTTQVSVEMPAAAVQGGATAVTIGRSEGVLLVPGEGALGAADTWPAPPGSSASREVARVGEALRAAPVAAPAFAAGESPAGFAAPPPQVSSPQVSSPQVSSPQVSSPQVLSPQVSSPQAAAHAYGPPSAPGYGAHPYAPAGAVEFGPPPQSYRQPPAGDFSPTSGPWPAPRQSVIPPARLLPAILVALVVLIVAAFTAFALLRYRATGRVFGAASYRSPAIAASFRIT
jgi:serine/threonine protein kinase